MPLRLNNPSCPFRIFLIAMLGLTNSTILLLKIQHRVLSH
jgi:hypothetical protein